MSVDKYSIRRSVSGDDRGEVKEGVCACRVRVNEELVQILRSKLKRKQFWKTVHFLSKLHDSIYENDREVCFLPTTYLIRLYGRKAWYKMRKLLSTNGLNVVSFGRAYKIGAKFRSYRLRSPFNRDLTAFDFPRGILKDPHLEIPVNLKERAASRNEVKDWIKGAYQLTSFSSDPLALLLTLPFPIKEKRQKVRSKTPPSAYYPERARELSIKKLETVLAKQGNFTTDRAGRIHYPLTVLKRELRPLLLINNEATVEIDACCSQPTLHASLYDPQSPEHLTEREKFLSLTASATFYETVARWDPLFPADGTRDAAKIFCFNYVFYGCIFPYVETARKKAQKKELPPILTTLKQEFPILFDLMAALKIRGNDKLPLVMQQTEARIMFSECAPRLIKEKISFLPIHDSLIVQKSVATIAEQIFRESWLKAVGFAPKFKTKPAL